MTAEQERPLAQETAVVLAWYAQQVLRGLDEATVGALEEATRQAEAAYWACLYSHIRSLPEAPLEIIDIGGYENEGQFELFESKDDLFNCGHVL